MYIFCIPGVWATNFLIYTYIHISLKIWNLTVNEKKKLCKNPDFCFKIYSCICTFFAYQEFDQLIFYIYTYIITNMLPLCVREKISCKKSWFLLFSLCIYFAYQEFDPAAGKGLGIWYPRPWNSQNPRKVFYLKLNWFRLFWIKHLMAMKCIYYFLKSISFEMKAFFCTFWYHCDSLHRLLLSCIHCSIGVSMSGPSPTVVDVVVAMFTL